MQFIGPQNSDLGLNYLWLYHDDETCFAEAVIRKVVPHKKLLKFS